MGRQCYIMLLGSFVLVSAFEDAHPFLMGNAAGNETQPVAMVDDKRQAQEPNIGDVAKFDSGVGARIPEDITETQTTVSFTESEGGSIAENVERTLLDTSSSEPSPFGNVGENFISAPVEVLQRNQEPNVGNNSSVSETNIPAEETQPRRDTDRMLTVDHSPSRGGIHKMFRSIVNVIAGSDSQVNNHSIPVIVNSQTQRTASRLLVYQESDEDSDSLEDDISDEMRPPMPVLLAQVKQFVQAKTRAGNSPVGSSLIEQDHSMKPEGSTLDQQVVGKKEAAEPPHRVVHVVADSDEEDHSNEDDVSLEVDINLLPEMRRFLRPNIGNRETMRGHRQTLFFQDNEDTGRSLFKVKDILGNPIFEEKMRQIDNRLKRASGARGKRLMEKYAEALTVYSPPFVNMASTSITFYSFLPFFITCLLTSLS